MPPKKKAKTKAKAAASKVTADEQDEDPIRSSKYAQLHGASTEAQPRLEAEEELEAEDEGKEDGDQQPAAADASSAAASSGKREAEDSAASAPPAKKAKAEKKRMNLNEVVCKGYETWSLSRIADAPVSALQGIGAQAEGFLRKLRIKTVRDLAEWKFFRAASAITVLAPLEAEGKRPEDSAMNLNQILDKAYETKPLQEIVELKPSALQGLAAAAEKALAGLHIKTVGQLGEWKHARWAEYIVTLAGFEDPKDEKPADRKSATDEKLAEQAVAGEPEVEAADGVEQADAGDAGEAEAEQADAGEAAADAGEAAAAAGKATDVAPAEVKPAGGKAEPILAEAAERKAGGKAEPRLAEAAERKSGGEAEPRLAEVEVKPAGGKAEEARPAEEAKPRVAEAGKPKSPEAAAAEDAKPLEEAEESAKAADAKPLDEDGPYTPSLGPSLAPSVEAADAKPLDEDGPYTPSLGPSLAPSLEAATAEDTKPLEEVEPHTPAMEDTLPGATPRTPEEDDGPLLPVTPPRAALDASSGEALDAEGDDVWQRLGDALADPLLTAQDAKHRAQADASDIDDFDDLFQLAEEPEKTSAIEEINKINEQVKETDGDWHKEEWEKKKAEEDEVESKKGDDEAEGEDAAEGDWADRYKRDEEEQVDADTWVYDKLWTGWSSNSKEALAAQETVRKIRGRTMKPKPKTISAEGAEGTSDAVVPAAPGPAEPMENFPSPELLEHSRELLLGANQRHKMLLTALVWVEANSLEVQDLPPDLSSAALALMNEEQDTLLQANARVPAHAILKKADAVIPIKEIRDRAVNLVQSLIKALRDQLEKNGNRPGGKKLELDDEEGNDVISQMVEEMLGGQPWTVQIMALVHCFEVENLTRSQGTDLDSLATTLSKQSMLDKAVETVCRLSLEDAIVLALQSMYEDSKTLRSQKTDCLNRLYVMWKLSPADDHLAQIHMLSLSRQLQVLLSVERDIEMFWYKLSASRSKTKEEQNKELRAFLNFDNLLKDYMMEKDLTATARRVLEKESGLQVATTLLASIRQGTSDVLKILKKKYQWTPSMQTKREISRTNWVARLASTLRLASKTSCLFADEELRKLLREDGHKKLGGDVYVEFQQWYKLERSQGLKISRQKTVDPQTYAEIQEKIASWAPDSQRYPVQQGPIPATPANLGAGGMTPGAGMATPGISQGLATPGTASRAPTPQWGGANLTPQYRPGASTPMGPAAGTPAGAPPATPGMFRAGPGTPAGPPPATPGKPPGTPAGPPPATPGVRAPPGTPAGPPPATPGARPPGTPAGPPPATPGFSGVASGTPAGPPPATPGFTGMPMTPAGAAAAASPMPMTPRGAAPYTPVGPAAAIRPGQGMPQTPGQAVPFTPAGAAPGTAASSRSMPMTPGNAVPFTPAGPSPGTAAMGRSMPMTPGNAVPFTPAGPAPGTAAGNRSMPMTPGNAVPFTPAGPPPTSMPMTPGGAMPFTPAGPAPATAGGFSAPMTPVGAFAPGRAAAQTGSAPPVAAAATPAPQTPMAAFHR
eukprot:TRINITY_DN496_c0_g1_i1.p1 TRINITY_DN496_c0_g1~~TRINITY_DN496_c0_g1_i1.p1  ORF type:complete len:1538 (-),score=424.38 TRINITY_DN496_c0_g1_i1:140-4714(-)